MLKKKITCFLLAIVTMATLGGLTACSKEEVKKEDSFGFNCYDEIQYVTTENILGRLRACSDEGFYTEGSASLKVTIQKPTSYNWHRYGEKKDFLPPTLKLPIKERNINTAQAFLLDVYNANIYDSGVYMYAKSAGKIIWSGYCVAQAGKWNKLAFTVNGDFANGTISDVYVAIADTNENTTYYFDNLQVVEGEGKTPTIESNGNTVVAFSTANEIKAAGFYTKTDVPAAHLAFATAPDGKTALLVLNTENYSGRINSVSYMRDDREYGFTVAKSVLENFDFTSASTCYIEVYNACCEPKKIKLTVADGENIATSETEIPVGAWTKVSVNDLSSIELAKISEVTVTLNAYNNFEAGSLYFKNLSVEVGK